MAIFIFNEKGTVNLNCCPGKDIKSTPPIMPKKAAPEASAGSSEGSCASQLAQEKFTRIERNNKVPSALFSLFFYLLRRFLGGKFPQNQMEENIFNLFKKISPELRKTMESSLKRFELLPLTIREKLCSVQVEKLKDNPIAIKQLTPIVLRELSQRSGIKVHEHKVILNRGVPGNPRPIPGVEPKGMIIPVIYQINGFQTMSLSSLSSQFQQGNFLRPVDSKSPVECTVQHVPEVKSGSTVTLKGCNFVDVNAKIRISSMQNSSFVAEVETQVSGDLETPVTEIVNGKEVVIADHRVEDTIIFKLPRDLPEGLYTIEVIVENNTGVGEPGRYLSGEQFIQVFSPSATGFQITGQKVVCLKKNQTERTIQVELCVLAIPIEADYNIGEIVNNSIKLENVGKEKEQLLDRIIFKGTTSIEGLSLAIIGYEINDDPKQKQIHKFAGVFVEVVKTILETVRSQYSKVKEEINSEQGLNPYWGYGSAAAVTEAVLIFYSIWDLPNLVIDDHFSFTFFDLAKMTSNNYPMLPITKYNTGEIDVKVEGIIKDVKYLEKRTYTNRDAKSIYQIVICYDRL